MRASLKGGAKGAGVQGQRGDALLKAEVKPLRWLCRLVPRGVAYKIAL
jgi:hypothetical protein